jgi:hypothetical protein
MPRVYHEDVKNRAWHTEVAHWAQNKYPNWPKNGLREQKIEAGDIFFTANLNETIHNK